VGGFESQEIRGCNSAPQGGRATEHVFEKRYKKIDLKKI
jgi:hypothetical protein